MRRLSFRYFKTQDYYGVSCYSRLLVHGNKENRGAIMRSIGVLMTAFTTLHEHKLFLTAQVEYVFNLFISPAKVMNLNSFLIINKKTI